MSRKINFKKITLEKFAAVISRKLKEHRLDCVLVGGACVSIYSHSRYQSYDLDFVTFEDMKQIGAALKELEFKKRGKYFIHPDCKFFIEFVSPPVAIGDEPVKKFRYYRTPLGTIKMLLPTDTVKDRLAGYYYWDDRQSLDQTIAICRGIPKKIDMRELKRWSKKERHLEECYKASQKYKCASCNHPSFLACA